MRFAQYISTLMESSPTGKSVKASSSLRSPCPANCVWCEYFWCLSERLSLTCSANHVAQIYSPQYKFYKEGNKDSHIVYESLHCIDLVFFLLIRDVINSGIVNFFVSSNFSRLFPQLKDYYCWKKFLFQFYWFIAIKCKSKSLIHLWFCVSIFPKISHPELIEITQENCWNIDF